MVTPWCDGNPSEKGSEAILSSVTTHFLAEEVMFEHKCAVICDITNGGRATSDVDVTTSKRR